MYVENLEMDNSLKWFFFNQSKRSDNRWYAVQVYFLIP